jgi:sterol-4alpha-carboxylate 3-dehydrogenase (decarboxylating)
VKDQRVDGEAFNLSNGEPWLLREAARFVRIRREGCLEGLHGVLESVYCLVSLEDASFVMLKMMKKYTAQRRTFNIAKAKQGSGYEPRVSVEDKFHRGLRWYVAQTHGDWKDKKV